MTGPVEGPQTPKTGLGANGPPHTNTVCEGFPTCIVFISPPEVEMCENTQTLLEYWLHYIFGVDLRRKSGLMYVNSDFLCSLQRKFSCFVSIM